jgi:hypothetical protein
VQRCPARAVAVLCIAITFGDCQYASRAEQAVLKPRGMVCSMNRKGNRWVTSQIVTESGPDSGGEARGQHGQRRLEIARRGSTHRRAQLEGVAAHGEHECGRQRFIGDAQERLQHGRR